MSVYTTIFAGSTPIGGLLMGAIASGLGIAVAMAVGGVLSLAVGLGAFAWIRRRGLDRPIRASAAAPAAASGAALGPAGALPGSVRPS